MVQGSTLTKQTKECSDIARSGACRHRGTGGAGKQLFFIWKNFGPSATRLTTPYTLKTSPCTCGTMWSTLYLWDNVVEFPLSSRRSVPKKKSLLSVGAGVQVSSYVVKNHYHINIMQRILCEIDAEIARGLALQQLGLHQGQTCLLQMILLVILKSAVRIVCQITFALWCAKAQ